MPWFAWFQPQLQLLWTGPGLRGRKAIFSPGRLERGNCKVAPPSVGELDSKLKSVALEQTLSPSLAWTQTPPRENGAKVYHMGKVN